MTELKFRWDALPQSVNKLYFVRGGRKILSKQGERFKNAFILSHGGVEVLDLMNFQVNPEGKYELELWFFLEPSQLYNLSYGQDKRVKYKFANIDTSNMIKLAEDCIAELTGIPDRNNWTVIAHKRESPAGSYMRGVLRPLGTHAEPD